MQERNKRGKTKDSNHTLSASCQNDPVHRAGASSWPAQTCRDKAQGVEDQKQNRTAQGRCGVSPAGARAPGDTKAHRKKQTQRRRADGRATPRGGRHKTQPPNKRSHKQGLVEQTLKGTHSHGFDARPEQICKGLTVLFGSLFDSILQLPLK